jgi:hypothetical protein
LTVSYPMPVFPPVTIMTYGSTKIPRSAALKIGGQILPFQRDPASRAQAGTWAEIGGLG